MRKTLKVLHTVSASGLVGGVFAYMVLLIAVQPDGPEALVAQRDAIAAISNYVFLPSLGVALVSGLLAMVAHRPFMDLGWVWLKAALGILMFKAVLTVVGAKADYAAGLASKIAAGTASPEALERMLAFEWGTLLFILAVSVANVVLGVWRPLLRRRRRAVPTRVARSVPSPAAAPVDRAA